MGKMFFLEAAWDWGGGRKKLDIQGVSG